MRFYRIRLKIELLRLLNASRILGLIPRGEEPIADCKANKAVIQNILDQQKTVLQGYLGIDLDSGLEPQTGLGLASLQKIGFVLSEGYDKESSDRGPSFENAREQSVRLGAISFKTDGTKVLVSGKLELDQLLRHISDYNAWFTRVPLSSETINQLEGEDDDTRKEPIVVAVMGVTGAGKSSFINLALGTNLKAGHGLFTCKWKLALFLGC